MREIPFGHRRVAALVAASVVMAVVSESPSAFGEPPSVVDAVSPRSGPRTGGTAVTIEGSGFTGASEVRFGRRSSPSFTVQSDETIDAIAPAGSGTVDVTVTTDGGVSSIAPRDRLSDDDDAFESGIGSWRDNVNADLSWSAERSHRGTHSLRVAPVQGGFLSAVTDPYPTMGGSLATGSAWVSTEAPQQIRVFLAFYDDTHTVVGLAPGPYLVVGATWSRIAVSEAAPAQATSVEVGVDVAEGAAPLFVDDAALRGSDRFTYRRPPGVPLVRAIRPNVGSTRGGTRTTIIGRGLTGATAVRFGGRRARSFHVVSDRRIDAVVPAGTGGSRVRVSNTHGTSAMATPNMLREADTNFETGTGTWFSNVNATVTLSSAHAHSGTYALKVAPSGSDFDSAHTVKYRALSRGEYTGSLWVRTSSGPEFVRAYLAFWDVDHQLVHLAQGAFVDTRRRWTRLRVTASAPPRARFVEIGVDDQDGDVPIFVDDASMSGSTRFRYEPPIGARTVASGLAFPAAFTFTPGGRMVYGERNTGRIMWLDPGGRPRPVFRIPNVVSDLLRGFLGLAVDPAFPRRPYLYAYVTRRIRGAVRDQVVRVTVHGATGTAMRVIFDSRNPAGRSHEGGRLLFGPGGMLYVAVGEGERPASAQNLRGPRGKILRITPTGEVPRNNPIPGSPIFVYGIRNSFGFDFDPRTGSLWGTDNGPSCNDELDRFVARRNYGWGRHQTCRGTEPENTNQDGNRPVLPLLWYTPVVVPTGVVFCERCGLGPLVRGALLFGTFKARDIRLVHLAPGRRGVASEHVVFRWPRGVLSLEQSPKGAVFFSDRAGIYRLVLHRAPGPR